MTDSSTGGYLPPGAQPSPLEDEALSDFLHDVIVGVTGLGGKVVTPRWQPDVPNLQPFGSDWIAFGVVGFDPDFSAATLMDEDNNFAFQQHETIDVLISSYGKNASRNLRLLSNGLQLSQNREALDSVGMGVLETGRLSRSPLLAKERWTDRYDMTLLLRREVRRTYPVLSLLSVGGSYIDNEKYLTPINVTQPAP